MSKVKSILLLLLCFLVRQLYAQQETEKYIYADTAIVTEAPAADTTGKVYNEEYEDEVALAEQTVIEVDTTVYHYRLTVAADSVAAWKGMKAFTYVTYLDSLLKAAQDEERRKREQQKNNDTDTYKYREPGSGWLDGIFNSGGLTIFLWMGAIVFVGFILYKLFVTDGAFRRTAKANMQQTAIVEEVITAESDFERLIREALQQRNYRLAVRYHFLQVLHTLAEKGHVQLAADKTNYNYVHEIKNVTLQKDFAALTLNYEYVWYGEFNIDELTYSKLKNTFTAFYARL
jgi:hypothetical protein